MLCRLPRGGEPVDGVDVVDEAIVHLDSRSEPWSVHLELHLGAGLDEARFRWAVEVALDRHPRARSRMVAASRRRAGYEWRTTPIVDRDPVDIVDCDGDVALAAARAELLSRPLPLDASPTLRIGLLRHPAGDVVVLSLHHAAGDGMAALVLMQSVARVYAGRSEAVADPPQRSAAVHSAVDRLRLVAAELGEALRPSTRIAPDGGREAPGYAFRLLRLDATRTGALRDRARDGTTVNDLLVAALHATVARWNADHGNGCRRVSVLMPVNLRSRQRWREGFGNLTFMLPVATLPPDRASMAATVEAVSRRTRDIKAQRSAATVAHALQRLNWLPLVARRWIARHAAVGGLVPTTLLSNLGTMEHDLDFGPGVGAPRHVWFSPPARMPLGMAVGALTAHEELHLVFRARHPLLGSEALARFAAYYQAALDALIAADDAPLRGAAARSRAA